ncbi:MAG: mannose-1-phosphate guanylyltransferase, partial [Candidatus Binatia bacterium]
RQRVPKQLLAITGRHSLLADTLARLRPLIGPARTYVVTAAAHAAAVRRMVGRLPRGHVLVEPEGRNTAAAIALAALRLRAVAPNAVMAVLPADHAIGDGAAFRATLARALDVAEATGSLVTLGVEPTHPETGYGYIEVGAPVEGQEAHHVVRFIEKPDQARASALIAAGNVLWNAGIFAWRVERVLAELREWVPEVVEPIARAIRDGGAKALARAYRRVPRVSIDTGVLERARAVAVVRATFPWSDVGSWAAVEGLWRRDGDPNAVRGMVVALDSRGCVVDAGSRLVALLGVEDLVVVDTPDAVLVCPKHRAQDVRLVVDELERRRLGRYR